MRTIHGVNRSRQPRDRKLKCWSSFDDSAVVGDVFGDQLDRPKFTRSSMQKMGPTKPSGFPQQIGPTKPSGFPQSPRRQHTSNTRGFILRPRQVLLKTSMLDNAKEAKVRTLGKSNSLPPIYGSRVTTMHGTGTCVPSCLVEGEPLRSGKKANISSVSTVKERALIRTQRDRSRLTSSVGLTCSSLAAFRLSERAQSLEPVHSRQREGTLGKPGITVQSHLALDPSNRLLGLVGNKSSDSGVMTGKLKDPVSTCETERAPLLLYSSSIDAETLSSQRKGGMGEEEESYCRGRDDQEEEFYTSQRIAEWVLRVNASLFSPSKQDVIKDQLLEEEDVDTIKIIYDQD